jgi:hypothetical protein
MTKAIINANDKIKSIFNEDVLFSKAYYTNMVWPLEPINPKEIYPSNCLIFISDNNEFQITPTYKQAGVIEYSLNAHVWIPIDSGDTTPPNKTIFMRGKMTGVDDGGVLRYGLYDNVTYEHTPWTLLNADNVYIYGKITSILDYENESISINEYAFYKMFSNNLNLIRAPEINILETNSFCCSYMFSNCQNLITVQAALKAESIAIYAYEGMFSDCKNLENIPTLEADNVELGGYSAMFSGCEKLSHAPILKAKTLGISAYAYMFSKCESLIEAPQLPCNYPPRECYSEMFKGCKNLKKAPKLPAKTLTNMVYAGMFMDCESLEDAPILPSTTLVYGCYSDMFLNCISLINPPELPSSPLPDRCYYSMFKNCISLVKMPKVNLYNNIGEDSCNNMFEGCISLLYVNVRFGSNVNMKEYACQKMFANCTSLLDYKEPDGIAFSFPINLAKNCYQGMFLNCVSLTKLPIIHASTLRENCFESMFRGCINIKLYPNNTTEHSERWSLPASKNSWLYDGGNSSRYIQNMLSETGGAITYNLQLDTDYYQ